MAGLQAADSVSHALQVQQWDGEVRQESKYAAELKQLDNGVKIPPRYTHVQMLLTHLIWTAAKLWEYDPRGSYSNWLFAFRCSYLSFSGWKCEVCDLQENIWMNLTDGKVLCGRRYFDGSGGNNHALLHYQQTGYPLAVKLGTITPDGAGEIITQNLLESK